MKIINGGEVSFDAGDVAVKTNRVGRSFLHELISRNPSGSMMVMWL